ncbi:Mdm33 family-domain-containing protein [Hypoxylon sp. FL1857]|nr:Mdm33 family-domain-containing protein [Hypoxylon sp. FL1857]
MSISTTRALKPLFGPGYRLLLEQLAPQSARKLILSSRVSNPVCPSCRHTFVLSSTQRHLRFYSSGSPPPKPPNNEDNKSPFENEFPFAFPPPSQEPSQPPSPSSQQPEPTPASNQSPAPEQPPAKDQQPPSPDPDLPSTQNSRRSTLNRKLSSFMDRAQTTLFAASQRINDLTGYSGIETLKSQISALESSLASAQSALHAARSAYKTAVSSRAATQREVTTLLARQKTWTPADFERFTALYRQDYELEASVAARAAELEEREREAERLGRELNAGILSRYHEEQIWSDKIRRMSTWGTWGLMGVNVLLFLVFQFGAEPWRRHRLVKGFEEKVREALEEERRLERALRETERREVELERRRVAELAAAGAPAEIPVAIEAVDGEKATAGLRPEEPAAESVTGEPPKMPWREESWRETLSDPDYWKAMYADLTSDRKVAIRMRDVSLIAVQSAAASAAIVGTILTVLLIRTR